MLYHYFKITLRNLRKHQSFTLINITGLATGVACCLLILLFVRYELSYDRWNSQADRIFRPVTEIKFGGSHMNLAVVGSVVGPDLQREFPEIQAYCRFRNYGSYLVKREGDDLRNIREDHALTVDSTFFEVFPVRLLAGDSRSCLNQPNTLVIAQSRAEKYFGSVQQAMGQTLVLDNQYRWQIRGVYEDLPENTHFAADLLLAMTGTREVQNDAPLWASSNNFHTYLLLRQDAAPKAFEAKFLAFSRKKVNETAQRLLGQDITKLEAGGQFVRYALQPLASIHLYSDLAVELSPNGSIQHVWIFSAIALFVLLIACINFMNLTTARSAHRAREIGVRKVLGSPRHALIRQFLGESVTLAGISVVLAVLLASASLPWFSELTNRPIAMPWGDAGFWAALLGGVLLVGLMAGTYPAFFLSAFDPVRTLKGEYGKRSGSGRLRSALVVFQFSTAIALIIATAMVYNQLNYIQHKKLGFQKDQVLILDDAYGLGDALEAYKTEVSKLPSVEAVTCSGYLPVPSSRSDQTFSKIREFREDQAVNMQFWRVDKDYLKTLGMELVSGRFFDPEKFPSDSSAIVLNETAAHLFGFEQAVGGKVYSHRGQVQGQSNPEDFDELTVIGVVRNFHFSSLRENIGALSMLLGRSNGNIAIRYKASDTHALISQLESKWKTMAPGQPFNYRFMDDAFARMYSSEQRIGKIAGIFALLAVLVSCLGLFGLAAFTAERRTKEIGIRRVLGATTPGIIGLLSKDFLKLVLIALVIAVPLAGYFMDRWLQDFAYRINIQIWIFVLAGGLALAVAFLTVSFQAVKAAMADPVRSLRSE